MAECRCALRLLTARPGFALMAILTFAPGIGASTTIFTVGQLGRGLTADDDLLR